MSQIDERLLELLQKLGMREYDAKVYLTLVRSGKTTVSDIYSVTGMPRNRIYDTLEDLQRRGFIETRQGRPMIYQAVPPEIVIKRIKEEWIQAIDGAASESLQRFKKLYVEKSEEKFSEFEFWSIKSISGLLDRASEVIRRARTFVLVEGHSESFLGSLTSPLDIAHRRGIDIYVVASQPIQDEHLLDSLKHVGTVKLVKESLFNHVISDDEAVFLLSQESDAIREGVYARAPFLIQAFATMLMEKFGLVAKR
ncbi:MAG: TrmB family transcriptional regulator [Thaumarchaeota archaeon]|nr:TrmB family transcriptional regulator [Nitrososphaerota archaeon]